MENVQTTVSPVDGRPIITRELPSPGQINQMLDSAVAAFKAWRKTSLEERLTIINRFLEAFEAEGPKLAEELTPQMGRPTRYTQGEIRGFLERARYLVAIAKDSLKDIELRDTDKEGFRRFIRKEPLGVCLCIGAWNFPYMIQVNALIPALLAASLSPLLMGNSVILKPSPQTPLTSENISRLLSASGLPPNVCQVLHTTPEDMSRTVADPRIAWVSFTGSVDNGARVDLAARGPDGKAFKPVMLELGGKDPAYVREDADPVWCAEEIADGAFFNSGQSCCAVERVYVHEKVYDTFILKLAEVAKGYILGDPMQESTTLGPVVSTRSANLIRQHVSEAIAQGARALVPEELFSSVAKQDSTYVAPQVLVDVNHSMRVMKEETFGPVVGVMRVNSDEEALTLMNDSNFGLTASVWTKDDAAFNRLANELEAGTVFMNRCDYLDPALAWTGVKQSGRGCSLSMFGYDAVTQLKSIHLRMGPKGVHGQ